MDDFVLEIALITGKCGCRSPEAKFSILDYGFTGAHGIKEIIKMII